MTHDLPWIPPRPTWAEPKPSEPEPPPLTKRQLKRRRYNANRPNRAANRAAAEAAAEAAADTSIARRNFWLLKRKPSRAEQHRETVERYYRHRGDQWRYGKDTP